MRQLADGAVQADHDVGRARAAVYLHEQLGRRTSTAAERLAELQQHWPTRAVEAIRADGKPPHAAAMLAAQSLPRSAASHPMRCYAGSYAEVQLRKGPD